MDEFRNKLIKSNKIYWLFIAFSFVGIAVLIIFSSKHRDGSGIAGFFSALIAVSALNIHRNKKALNDEKLFKEMYVRCCDERNLEIQREASKTTFFILFAGLAAASLVFTYIDEKICCVLSCCNAFVVLVYFGVTLYYRRKM